MAFTRILERENLEMVRSQLGEVISRFHRDEANIAEAELAETFEFYLLPEDAVPTAMETRDLKPHLHRTGSWMHLIKSRGRPLGIAHSSAQGSARSRWSLQNFFLAPVAPKIARAVDRIDTARTSESIEVTLIAVPSYQLDFFLLNDGEQSEIFVIACHEDEREYEEGQFYSQEEFLQRLSSTRPRVGLLNDEPRQSGR
jgi:hypothetical protein